MSVVSLGYGDGSSIAALGYGPLVFIVPVGPFPDPWAATSVVMTASPAASPFDWFGLWYGQWFGDWFGFGFGVAGTSGYPDPFAATSEPQDTLGDWINNPSTIPWIPATPEPDPSAYPPPGFVMLVDLNDDTGWLVVSAPASDPRPALDWSTVTAYAIVQPPYPDPARATSTVKSS